MSQLDDLLGGLLGGKGGDLLGQVLGGLTGADQDDGKQGTGDTGAKGAALVAALVPVLGQLLGGGGLAKILAAMRAKGLSAQSDSWVSTGANEPITADQVKDVLGPDEIAQIADALGVSQEQASAALAAALPQVVDRVSPDGQLPPESELDDLFAKITSAAR